MTKGQMGGFPSLLHELMLDLTDHPFLGPEGPSKGHAVNSVLQQPDCFPLATERPDFTVSQRISVLWDIDRVESPYIRPKPLLIRFHFKEHGKDNHAFLVDNHFLLKVFKVGQECIFFNISEFLIVRVKGGEWVAVSRVLGLVVFVELGECGHRSINQGLVMVWDSTCSYEGMGPLYP